MLHLLFLICTTGKRGDKMWEMCKNGNMKMTKDANHYNC